MSKNHCSRVETYRFSADRFYPWLIFLVIALSLGTTWWQISTFVAKYYGEIGPGWSIRDYLIGGLTSMALVTLVWRILFALWYRPYAPVPDSVLPVITVVIPAYNEGVQVLHTVRSVLASRYPACKMQVICVDDGSQDDTWQWMIKARKAFPKRLQLIRQPQNMGKRHALMAGFGQAVGEIFITIDSDSEVMPDTLRQIVSPMVGDPRVGAVAGNVRVLNLEQGAIPKMMEVSFTNAFDFIRSGQSVYGGVFCTPGALSAYRASVVRPHLNDWASQTFMGIPAAIGEDRALTNLILGLGHRVAYQRKAVVLTKMPTTYGGLRRMLLRWARSNVRENLVMLAFLVRRFRPNDSGGGWIRFFSATQLLRMTVGESFKVAVLAQLFIWPAATLPLMLLGCLIAAVLPAVVHQIRRGGWFGWKWALPYSFYWLFTLSWIPLWGLFTASRSGWLTRQLPQPPARSMERTAVLQSPQSGTPEAYSKAA